MNTTGIEPTEFNVLVKIQKVEARTAGGLHLPDTKVQRDIALNTRGVLVAASPLAFSYDDWKGSEGSIPQIGDTVIISKGAGVFIDDVGDGEVYRLLKDKDVCAVVRPVKVAKTREKAA